MVDEGWGWMALEGGGGRVGCFVGFYEYIFDYMCLVFCSNLMQYIKQWAGTDENVAWRPKTSDKVVRVVANKLNGANSLGSNRSEKQHGVTDDADCGTRSHRCVAHPRRYLDGRNVRSHSCREPVCIKWRTVMMIKWMRVFNKCSYILDRNSK